MANVITIVTKKEDQVMVNAVAHHLLTHARPTPGEHRSVSLPNKSPSLYTRQDMVWHIPLVSLGHLSQLCSLQVSFVSSLTAEHERKVLDSG